MFSNRPVFMVDEAGTEKYFYTIMDASNYSGTSIKTIQTVVNHDTFVNCSKIDSMCRFYEEGKTIKTTSPYFLPSMAPDYEGFDFYTLPLDKVVALDEDYNIVNTFNNIKEAAEYYGHSGKYYNISAYVNKRFIVVYLGGVAITLLFAQHPLSVGGKKPVVGTNIVTGEAFFYRSISEAMQHLNITIDYSYFIKKYVKKDNEYKSADGNVYKFVYAKDYTEQLPTLWVKPKKKLTIVFNLSHLFFLIYTIF